MRTLCVMAVAIAVMPTAAESQRTPRDRDAAEARAEARARAAEARARAEAHRRGWIGIAYSMSERDGAIIVNEVVPGSPAEEAGLRRGDVIVRWNGDREPAEAAMENPLRPGDTVRLRVRRGDDGDREITVVAGSARDRPVTVMSGRRGEVIVLRPSEVMEGVRIHMDSLGIHADSLHTRLRVLLRDSLGPALERFEAVELPRIEAELEMAQSRLAHLLSGSRSVAGAEFAEVNAGLASYFGTDHGALVLRVAPETPAARAGLQAGDVVVSANGRAVDDVRDLREAVSESRDDDVRLEIVRRGEREELRLRWE